MERFVRLENLALFKKRPAQPNTTAQREVFLKLPAGEELPPGKGPVSCAPVWRPLPFGHVVICNGLQHFENALTLIRASPEVC
jgi:hypothetical protein